LGKRVPDDAGQAREGWQKGREDLRGRVGGEAGRGGHHPWTGERDAEDTAIGVTAGGSGGLVVGPGEASARAGAMEREGVDGREPEGPGHEHQRQQES